MASEVRVPRLGWEMREGTLVDWLVADGAAVSEGEPLYVIENDKAETEVDAPASGVLKILEVTGEAYPVGHLIAEIA